MSEFRKLIGETKTTVEDNEVLVSTNALTKEVELVAMDLFHLPEIGLHERMIAAKVSFSPETAEKLAHAILQAVEALKPCEEKVSLWEEAARR